LSTIAAVVENHVRQLAVRPAEGLLGAPPVLGEGLSLPSENRHPPGIFRRTSFTDGDGRSGLVLGRENIAGGPAYLGAQLQQRFDEHRGLDRHVQRAGDARPIEGFLLAELLAQSHQPRHFHLGKLDLLAPQYSKGQILNLKIVHASHPSPCVGFVFKCASGPLRQEDENPHRLALP
jgi:hypothetical protein